MNYNEVISYIEKRNLMGSVLGLDNIKALLKKLGNPERSVPAMHIAGTNGKGSIMAYVENVLIEAGLKVGRYISPTIFDYRERWQICKEYISKEDCAELLSKVIGTVEEMEQSGEGRPTSFEIETAAAFLYFKEAGCDIMLIECGMGGSQDATNVFLKTPIDVIASISFDHMQFLGNTLEAITSEKLGIVKDRDILVSYPQSEIPEKVIDAFAADHKMTVDNTLTEDDALTEADRSASDEKNYQRYRKTDRSSITTLESGIWGTEFIYKNENYHISMAGGAQVYNAATAIEALEAFNDIADDYKLKKIDKDTVRKGLAKTFWPGRFTVIGSEPLFIADGAHNEDAWCRLSEDINKYFTNRKIIFIIGVLKDKEYDRMLDILTPFMKHAITLTSSSPRALDGRTLAGLIRERNVAAEYSESISDAIDRALEIADQESDSVIIACGSLSFIGDIIRVKKDKDNAKG